MKRREAAIQLIWGSLGSEWDSIGIPFRPSPEDVAKYSVFLSQGPNAALVFGATPEIRNLLASKGVKQIFVADSHREMIMHMERRVADSARSREKIIIADWNELYFLEDSLDVALGDVFWHWLLPSEQNVLLDKISRFVRPGGKFIARFYIAYTEPEAYDIEVVFNFIKQALFIHYSSISIARAWTSIFRILKKATRGEPSEFKSLFRKIFALPYSKVLCNIRKHSLENLIETSITKQSREDILKQFKNKRAFTLENTFSDSRFPHHIIFSFTVNK